MESPGGDTKKPRAPLYPGSQSKQKTVPPLELPFPQNSYSLFQISQIAQEHNIKLYVPPSILIGFEDNDCCMYTDGLTGVLKVIPVKAIELDQIKTYIQFHLQPLHYRANNQESVIAPRYVLKQLVGNSTSVQLFFCMTALLNTVQTLRSYSNLIIQQMLVNRGCKPTVFRFRANGATIYSAQACYSKDSIPSNTYIMSTIKEKCEQWKIQNNAPEHTDKHLPQVASKRHSSLSPTKQQSIFDCSGRKHSVKLKSASDSFYQMLVESQEFREKALTGSKKMIHSEKEKDNYRVINKIFQSLQIELNTHAVKDAWTVSLKREQSMLQLKTDIRPVAYAETHKTVMELFKLYETKFINQKKYGKMKSACFDFIEGQNGVLYFNKIQKIETTGPQPYQQEWKLSKDFLPTKASKDKQMDLHCHAQIMCVYFDNCDQIRADFEKQCKEKRLWRFDSEQVVGSVGERQLYLYKIELKIAMDSFSLLQDKLRVIPFYPLISFPDQTNPDYKWYQQQKRTYQNLIPMMSLSKQVTRFKTIRTSVSDKCFNIPTQELKPECHTVQVDENGDIIDQFQHKTLHACLLCATLIQLYTERHSQLIFKPEEFTKNLSKLKNTLCRDWDSQATQQVLSIYSQAQEDIVVKKKDSFKIKVVKYKPTQSSLIRVNDTFQKAQAVKFQNALIQIQKYRDQPDKVKQKVKDDFQNGPPEQLTLLKKRYSSISKLHTTKSTVDNNHIAQLNLMDIATKDLFSPVSLSDFKTSNLQKERLQTVKDQQHKAFVKLLKPQRSAKSKKDQKFSLQLKRKDRALSAVNADLTRVVISSSQKALPYVRSFTDLGYKLRKIK